MTFDLAIESATRTLPRTWRLEPFRRHATLVADMRSDRPLPLLSLASTGVVAPRTEDGGLGKQAPSEATIERYWVTQPGNLVVNPMWLIGGGVGVSAVNGAVSPDYRVYDLGPELYAPYVHHLLRSAPYRDQYRLYTRADTTFDRRVSKENFHPMPLIIPPLGVQRRIADFLDVETARIDHLRSKFTRQRTLLNERERTALPLTVAGARLGDGNTATGLAWLPAMHPSAQLVPLLRLLQLQRGADLSEDQRREGNVPVITTAGHAGWHEVALVKGPGVVIGRYGSVGNVHWVENSYWPHNTTLYVKNFNGNGPRYCYHVLRSLPYEMEQARAAVPGVNRNDLHRQKIALLPRDLQTRVVTQLDTDAAVAESTRQRIKRAEALLEERRQALITAAVTGQFDVSTASGRNVTDGVQS
ncbi:hypothetical protein AB0M87_21185 [Streptomyces sp. NPDC051320]|uniref:restriction endonuclease subunit S n=1 Tax=Streptomyces sp. NPDC051320 TaxID=3154644 RepID=UPI003417ECB7